MAPITRIETECITTYNITIDRNNTASANDYHEKDRAALLYIVCTLLFYSLGMMVGIVSYIKREKRDSEQERMFDEFLSSFSSKTDARHQRLIKVQETIERLAELERIKYLEDNSFENIGIRKLSGIGTRLNLWKVAKLGLLGAPTVKMSEENTRKRPNDETINEEDPFPDRRLSEVVANILDSEPCLNFAENDVEAPLVNYKREPRNQELERDNETRDVDLVDPSHTGSGAIDDNRREMCQPTVGSSKCKSDSNISQTSKKLICNNDHQITTTVGASIETVFGVNISRENSCEENADDKSRSEADLHEATKLKDSKHVWSVTSV